MRHRAVNHFFVNLDLGFHLRLGRMIIVLYALS